MYFESVRVAVDIQEQVASVRTAVLVRCAAGTNFSDYSNVASIRFK